MKDLKVAVGQFAAEIGEPQKNLSTIERLAEQAAKENAAFILFPEDCLTGYPSQAGTAPKVALTSDSKELDRLAQISHHLGLTIAAGGIERTDNHYHGAHFVVSPDG